MIEEVIEVDGEEFTIHNLYTNEHETVIVNKNVPTFDNEDVWYTLMFHHGTTVSDIQAGLNYLPEYAEYDSYDIDGDGTVWIDFLR